MKKKDRQENICRFFFSGSFSTAKKVEGREGREDTELWAVSCLGQGIQNLSAVPLIFRWDFFGGWFLSSKSSIKNPQRTPVTHYLGFGAIKWLFAALTFWYYSKSEPLFTAQSCLQASPWGAMFPIRLQQPVLLLGDKICFVCLWFLSFSCFIHSWPKCALIRVICSLCFFQAINSLICTRALRWILALNKPQFATSGQ